MFSGLIFGMWIFHPMPRLKLTGGQIYAGNAAADFEVSEPFVFEGV